eukprot:scaffold348989_cov20-Prasinocladus_malaysianus.AAC.1
MFVDACFYLLAADFDISGRMQFWTLPEERLILVNFKGRPKLKIRMTVKVARNYHILDHISLGQP